MNHALAHMVKLAKSNPKFLQSMISMAKIAADKDSKTKFDESVPASDMPKDNDQSLQQGAGRVPQAGDSSQVSQPNMQYPDDTAAFQGQEQADPISSAAQSFLGQEVYQEAMSGNENAMKLIAMTAAELGFRSNAAANAAAAPQDQGMPEDVAAAGVSPEEYQAMMESGQMPGGPGQEQAPAPMPTPEEQVANMIVAPQAAPAASPMQPNMPQQSGQGGQAQAPGKKTPPQPAKSDERKAADRANKENAQSGGQEKTSSVTRTDLLKLISILG